MSDDRIKESVPDARPLAWYMAGQGAWFTSIGLQFVLFPFLVANVLHETPARVGIAQMSLSAPALLFMLLGGATADRSDPRTILFRVHLFAAVPPLALATMLNADAFSYEVLIGYGLCMGLATAFAVPARDATLNRVAQGNIQRTVTLALAVQQTTQLLGMVAAISAAAFGAPLLFAMQSLILLGGGLAARQLPPKVVDASTVHAPRLRAMRDGLGYVRQSDVLLPVVIAMFAVGVFYIGSFLVILPLIVRDYYLGGVVELGTANIAFWGGTIVSTVFLLRFGHVTRRGRGMILALATGVAAVTGFSFEIPFWLFCTFSLIWGLGAGCVMTLSRTIVQAQADDAFRARALSIFQLGFSGGAPLGSLLMGVLAGIFGTHTAMWFPACGMTLVLAWLMLTSRLWSLRAPAA
ncbi:MAG: MFS transporter [Parvibaculaceae bacterium]